MVGIGKKLYGNTKGAAAEFKRAKQQFNTKLKIHHYKAEEVLLKKGWSLYLSILFIVFYMLGMFL